MGRGINSGACVAVYAAKARCVEWSGCYSYRPGKRPVGRCAQRGRYRRRSCIFSLLLVVLGVRYPQFGGYFVEVVDVGLLHLPYLQKAWNSDDMGERLWLEILR